MPKKLDAGQIGAIRGYFKQANATIAECQRLHGSSRTTIRSIKNGQTRRTDMDKGRRANLRKKNAKKADVADRRKTVARLAPQTIKFKEDKDGSVRIIPKYPTPNKMRLWFKEHRPHRPIPSVATLARDLKFCGFRCYVRPVVPYRQIQTVRRYKFCKNLNFRDPQYCRRIIFSDEHVVTANDNTSKTCWAMKRSQVPTRQQKSKYNSINFMFWAAIGYNYKSPIIWMDFDDDEETPKSTTLTQTRYRNFILQRIREKLTNKRTIFMQDGARPHTGKVPVQWLEQNKVTWIRDWPANSPDLNPIEEIWKEVNRELAERGVPQSTAEIKQMVEEIWRDYPMSKVNNHVMSFMSKCKTCVKNRGGLSH